MPCYDSRDELYPWKDLQDRCNAATKAACEMAKLLRNHLNKLSPSTRQWVRKHDALDKLHKEQDRAR